MRNVLIFAGIAGIAAAIAIYFVSESNKGSDEDYITDVDINAYDKSENTGEAISTSRGFHAMS